MINDDFIEIIENEDIYIIDFNEFTIKLDKKDYKECVNLDMYDLEEIIILLINFINNIRSRVLDN